MPTLPITSIIEWQRGTTTVVPTEHNRDAVGVSYDRIEYSDRMNNGRLRKYYVNDKRTWSVAWTMLPAPSEETVDQKAGGHEMEQFYLNTPGEFLLTIKHADGTLDEEPIKVVFSSFSKTHVRRGAYDFWDLNLSMEEC